MNNDYTELLKVKEAAKHNINRQGLRYSLRRELPYNENYVEVIFELTNTIMTVTKDLFKSGEFDDAVAVQIFEVMSGKSVSAEMKDKKPTTKKSASKKTTPKKEDKVEEVK